MEEKLEQNDILIGKNLEILDVAKTIAKEKGISAEEVLEAMEVASDLAKASCFVSLQGVFFCSRQSSSAVADATEVSPLDIARTLVVGLYDMSPKLLSEPMSNSALFQIASVVVAVPLM